LRHLPLHQAEPQPRALISRASLKHDVSAPQRSPMDGAEISPSQLPQQEAVSHSENQKDQQEDSVGVKAALALLKAYKAAISPLLPPSCRFLPTCSGNRQGWCCGGGSGQNCSVLLCHSHAMQLKDAVLRSPAVYAMEAFQQHGVSKGFVLTAWRLLRCTPWGNSGYDPVCWPPPGLEAIFKA
jgi:hypothetical protein